MVTDIERLLDEIRKVQPKLVLVPTTIGEYQPVMVMMVTSIGDEILKAMGE